MFSVVYKLVFHNDTYFIDKWYKKGDSKFCHIFVTAPCLSEANFKAEDYFEDHCDGCHVHLISISRVM